MHFGLLSIAGANSTTARWTRIGGWRVLVLPATHLEVRSFRRWGTWQNPAMLRAGFGGFDDRFHGGGQAHSTAADALRAGEAAVRARTSAAPWAYSGEVVGLVSITGEAAPAFHYVAHATYSGS